MAHCNENYLNLQGAYLFAEVRKKQEAYIRMRISFPLVSVM